MFISDLIRSELSIDHRYNLNMDEGQKNLVKKRCDELGISKIVDFNTGDVNQNMSFEARNLVVENVIFEKAKTIGTHFFTPSKKDVKNAINFLEVLGIFASKVYTGNPTFGDDNTKVISKRAGKMLKQLENLRKNMAVSKSTLKSDAKTAIVAVDKVFSDLSLTEKVALKDAVNNAEKIIKAYFK